MTSPIDDGLVVDATGTKRWYHKGKLHREDGPAVEYVSGTTAYYIHGKNMIKKRYNNWVNRYGKYPSDPNLSSNNISPCTPTSTLTINGKEIVVLESDNIMPHDIIAHVKHNVNQVTGLECIILPPGIHLANIPQS